MNTSAPVAWNAQNSRRGSARVSWKKCVFTADRSQNGSCALVMKFPSWRWLLLRRVAASSTANDPNTANTLVPRVKDEMNWRRQEKKQISHSTRWLIAIHIPAVARFRREKKRLQRVSFRGISLRRSCTDAD